MRSALVIDFETTNKDPKVAKPVEVALVDCRRAAQLSYLINPGVSIPPETSAVHHIIDSDVEGKPDWDTVWTYINRNVEAAYEDTPVILVAHNANYEKEILRNKEFSVPVEWVDTYKCGLFFYEEAPSFSNEGLRYYLELGDRGRQHSQNTHSALHDCQVTKLLYLEMLQSATEGEMVEISNLPAQYPRILFGKHRDKTWPEIPADYLLWITQQKDMDDGVVFCARRELTKRGYLK